MSKDNNDKKEKLRLLPAVHELVSELKSLNEFKDLEKSDATDRKLIWAVRKALEKARKNILKGDTNGENKEFFKDLPDSIFALKIKQWLKEEIMKDMTELRTSLKRVINATGVILHTNCGRALLSPEVVDFMAEQARSYSNLELHVDSGTRGSRYVHVEQLLTALTGAEAALVVNNNAAAVLLIMNTFAAQKEVIVSRGELVEVGGSFRIPEVLKAGGARLVEVGTTNKTWLKDYRDAINNETSLILKVHTSNYRIEGFHHSVSAEDLVNLGKEHGIPVVEDLGSGSFLDGEEFGLPREPTISEAVKAGVALVTFSGDKLLGGPQAGIIVGKKELVEKLKTNQLTRALRVDKLTLAALEGTLRLYERGEVFKIPVWRMLSMKKKDLLEKAQRLKKDISEVTSLETKIQESFSRVGGGAFPTAELPTFVCAVKPLRESVMDLENFLRQGKVPILARIFKDFVLFDPRTLLDKDYEDIVQRLKEWDEKQNRYSNED